MATEIERKFLVHANRLGDLGAGEDIEQGFLPTSDLTAVRVRISGGKAWLTIKGETQGATRLEFEYAIPLQDARDMLATLCGESVIRKRRYRLEHGGHLWEIDIFEGDNAGLIVAEVELEREDEPLDLPDWVAGEVTSDPRYYNVNLISNPFRDWG